MGTIGLYARLGAVALTLAASLPGPLQLAHEHSGGEHAHVHPDAAHLAAHDLVDHDGHHHHADAHPHGAEAPHAEHDGPSLQAAGSAHVHPLNPFHLVARTATASGVIVLGVERACEARPRNPESRPRLAARSRGPPLLLAG